MNRSNIDACQITLHELGWSCGDLAYRDDDRVVWQVFARRGEQNIVARATRQRDAWQAAVEQAGRLQKTE
jgi:hypothetical protein